ncbi:unnamed protein product [Dovyalis caffra]|uniref:Uncharacterized protein n=1 Tax=Dovyalis caffra TaxID=77055 RepID=A0AAV1RV00_9ROSI|nr:unnamed protein product [Dovyalis caffra]
MKKTQKALYSTYYKDATEIDYPPRICEGPGEEAADNQSSGKKQENSRTKANAGHCSMMEINVGDFLVFNFVGDRTFDVVIYEPSGCVKDKVASNPNRNPTSSRQTSVSIARNQEKPTKKHDQAGSSHLSVKSSESPDNDGRIDANAEEIGGIGERERVAEAIRSVTPNHPIFVQVLKDYQKYSMFVPRDIVRETGLAKKKVVVIKAQREGNGK